VPYDTASYNTLAAGWPGLGSAPVCVGGLAATFAEAARAAALLMSSRTSAIAPVLRAARSPLAGCDYFAAAAPYLAAARSLPKTGRAGAAGRHVTKIAFLEAVGRELDRCAAAEMGAAMAAFASDERYAVSIARDAVTLRERAHLSGLRSSVRSAVLRAVADCGTHRGEFSCTEAGACGTGACRFTQAPYRQLTAAAGPGRIARPYNHRDAGQGFSEAGAAAELADGSSWQDGVPVSDCMTGAAVRTGQG
jgi:hypothetical protein